MCQPGGRKAAADDHPAGICERRAERQQEKRTRAEIGEQIEWRDTLPAASPIHEQNGSFEHDDDQDEIDKASARK